MRINGPVPVDAVVAAVVVDGFRSVFSCYIDCLYIRKYVRVVVLMLARYVRQVKDIGQRKPYTYGYLYTRIGQEFWTSAK